MKLLALSSFSYQILDRSRHRVTTYLNAEKTRCAVSSYSFKKLKHVNDQRYEVKLVKAEVEHKEPVIVGFFIHQKPKLKMLEVYYTFLLCSVILTNSRSWKWTKFPSILSSLEKKLIDCFRLDMKTE